jgi:diaminopimelate epimerase
MALALLRALRPYKPIGTKADHAVFGGAVTWHFEKWQGLGNHFILAESMPRGWSVAQLCDPSRGIGADGFLLLSSDPPRMIIFNADGSRPALCGNGLRCAARYWSARNIDLSAGIVTDNGRLQVLSAQSDVCVEIGRPRRLGGGEFAGATYQYIDTGNPHAVFIEPDKTFDLTAVGGAMQGGEAFPDGVNVHLVRRAAKRWSVTPFERGVGLTQACGTGAAAAAFALATQGAASWPMTIDLPGGPLGFALSPDGALMMSGAAERVFSGSLSER